jgi:hypothetical protein
VAYGILLRPLPYADAERVAVVYMRFFPRDFAFGTMCIRDYLMWKENNHAFEDPSLFQSLQLRAEGYQSRPFGCGVSSTVSPWLRFLRPPYTAGTAGLTQVQFETLAFLP